MTLQQKVAWLIGEWHGLDATERAAKQDQLAGELIQLVTAEATQPARADATPFCAFCAPRHMDSLLNSLVRPGSRAPSRSAA